MTPRTSLKEETLDAIERLLIRRTVKNEQRGVYTENQIDGIKQRLRDLAVWFEANKPARLREKEVRYSPTWRFSHRDVLCISYIDHVVDGADCPAAQQLATFFTRHLKGLYSHLHILPHFPCPIIHNEIRGPASRADGGFEPMSYQMDPKFGEPEDLQAIDADLMFDFVLNHLSVKGEWFRRFLEDEPEYRDFFLTISEAKLNDLDLSGVFRPRQHHPVFKFCNGKGQVKHIWCTFSETQADINIKNPAVFCKVMEALVKDFVGQGASWIRLDAVGYLVKMLGLEPGEPKSSCFGIEETHNILKAMNLLLRDIAPSVTLVAEVNATADVIQTYYGTNGDEAQMVYEFPIAPISLFAIYTGNALPVLQWAKRRTQHPQHIGLAFTNSHDGIGVLPMNDLPPLPDGTSAMERLLSELESRGAGVNYKLIVENGKYRKVPYEACITWLQAVLTPRELDRLQRNRLDGTEIDLIADRFVASQSFTFTVPHCVPADYLGAITGQLNDEALFNATDHNRNKNRGQIQAEVFENALDNPKTAHEKLVNAVFCRKRRLLQVRREHPAFSPHALCNVGVGMVEGADERYIPVYSVLRRSNNGTGSVLALTNCTPWDQAIFVSTEELGSDDTGRMIDLLSERTFTVEKGGLRVELAPFKTAWLSQIIR